MVGVKEQPKFLLRVTGSVQISSIVGCSSQQNLTDLWESVSASASKQLNVNKLILLVKCPNGSRRGLFECVNQIESVSSSEILGFPVVETEIAIKLTEPSSDAEMVTGSTELFLDIFSGMINKLLCFSSNNHGEKESPKLCVFADSASN